MFRWLDSIIHKWNKELTPLNIFVIVGERSAHNEFKEFIDTAKPFYKSIGVQLSAKSYSEPESFIRLFDKTPYNYVLTLDDYDLRSATT